jgi:hypothetical protein
MADIFVSWGLPDAQIVTPMVARLRDAGFDVWSYTDSMLAGVNIPADVQREIDAASMAVVLLSPSSSTRPWIATEIAWCVARQTRDPAFHILPLRFGTLPSNPLAHLQADLRSFDLPEGPIDHANMVRLAENVQRLLNYRAPLVVPARILAMTYDQFDDLLPEPAAGGTFTGAANPRIEDLCRAVGMEPFPGLRAVLRQRYRGSCEDFSPFTDDPAIEDRLIDVVHRIQREVNQQRRASQLQPLWLRWCGDELFDATTDAGRALRDGWQAGPSLLIVDSISALHQEIREQFQNVPPSLYPKQAALLWVPPYTRHTVRLRQFTDNLVQILPNLHTRFQNWDQMVADSHTAFDIATSVSLRRWLYRAFADVTSGLLPLPSNVSTLRDALQAGDRFTGNPSQFFGSQNPR